MSANKDSFIYLFIHSSVARARAYCDMLATVVATSPPLSSNEWPNIKMGRGERQRSQTDVSIPADIPFPRQPYSGRHVISKSMSERSVVAADNKR